MTKAKIRRVKFAGAPGAVNREVGAAAGTGGELEPGEVYSVPAELAERLVSSSSSWTPQGWTPAETEEAEA